MVQTQLSLSPCRDDTAVTQLLFTREILYFWNYYYHLCANIGMLASYSKMFRTLWQSHQMDEEVLCRTHQLWSVAMNKAWPLWQHSPAWKGDTVNSYQRIHLSYVLLPSTSCAQSFRPEPVQSKVYKTEILEGRLCNLHWRIRRKILATCIKHLLDTEHSAGFLKCLLGNGLWCQRAEIWLGER
jgi:hypothetical protein